MGKAFWVCMVLVVLIFAVFAWSIYSWLHADSVAGKAVETYIQETYGGDHVDVGQISGSTYSAFWTDKSVRHFGIFGYEAGEVIPVAE